MFRLFPLLGFGLLGAMPLPAQTPRVLFLTHSAGYAHEVVKRAEPRSLSLAESQLALAAKGKFEVEATQDCAAISAENLRRFAAVAFFTSGDLPFDDAQKTALFEYVRGGGAFAAIHSGSATLEKCAPYGELVGGVFDGHPWHQLARIKVEDRAHPATSHLGEAFEVNDEVYQHRDWSREKVHVLLSADPASLDLSKGKRADRDYALAWTHAYGAGRVFYTALGHPPEFWKDERFLRHVVGGIDSVLAR